MEEGEDRETAARREIQEETGLQVTKIIDQTTYPDPENPHTKHFFIVCEVEDGEPTLGGPEKEHQSITDQYEPKWVNIMQALEFEHLYPVPIKNYLRDMQHDAHESKSH